VTNSAGSSAHPGRRTRDAALGFFA
jgi:hypothetical protein